MRRDLIGRGGQNAALDFRPEGILIRCRVLDTTAARDAAELVRANIFAGWSVELIPTKTRRDMSGLLVLVEAYLFGAALVWVARVAGEARAGWSRNRCRFILPAASWVNGLAERPTPRLGLWWMESLDGIWQAGPIVAGPPGGGRGGRRGVGDAGGVS